MYVKIFLEKANVANGHHNRCTLETQYFDANLTKCIREAYLPFVKGISLKNYVEVFFAKCTIIHQCQLYKSSTYFDQINISKWLYSDTILTSLPNGHDLDQMNDPKFVIVL